MPQAVANFGIGPLADQTAHAEELSAVRVRPRAVPVRRGVDKRDRQEPRASVTRIQSRSLLHRLDQRRIPYRLWSCSLASTPPTVANNR